MFAVAIIIVLGYDWICMQHTQSKPYVLPLIVCQEPQGTTGRHSVHNGNEGTVE